MTGGRQTQSSAEFQKGGLGAGLSDGNRMMSAPAQMKRITVLLLTVILLAAACSREPTWEEQFDLGQRYLTEGNYQAAVLAFTQAIEIDPKQTTAYLNRADARLSLYAESENDTSFLQQAIDDFQSVISLDPSIAEAYSGMSDAYMELGEIRQALEALQQGVEATGDASLQSTVADIKARYGSVEFTVQRQDPIYTSPVNGLNIPLHYDLVTVSGNEPRIQKINQVIQQDFENFKAAGGPSASTVDRYGIGIRHEWLYTLLNYEDMTMDDVGGWFMPCEVTAEVTCNSNGILSIRYQSHYLFDYACDYGLTFDLLSGELLSYTDLFADNMQSIASTVRSYLQSLGEEQRAMGMNGIEEALGDQFDFSRLEYYIENDELIVCTPRMFAGDGSVFTEPIPCGCYIEKW